MKRTVARAIAVGTFLFVTVSLLALSGCTDGDAEDARKEAREAKKKVSTLELSLARAQQQITDLKEELNVVRETRDELQRQVDQLVPELDKARLVAGEAEQIITHLSTRAEGQNTATAALEKEMAGVPPALILTDHRHVARSAEQGSYTVCGYLVLTLTSGYYNLPHPL